MTKPFCVVVSSCDAYADCWPPFFTLLAKYWQPFDLPIYLNTETAAFDFPGLDISCPRVERDTAGSLGWSERLMHCLDRVPYDTVLYLQEDYFLNDTVDSAMIDKLVQLMARDGINHISLTRARRRPSGSSSGTAREERVAGANHSSMSMSNTRHGLERGCSRTELLESSTAAGSVESSRTSLTPTTSRWIIPDEASWIRITTAGVSSRFAREP
jgi:hypothetical protein